MEFAKVTIDYEKLSGGLFELFENDPRFIDPLRLGMIDRKVPDLLERLLSEKFDNLNSAHKLAAYELNDELTIEGIETPVEVYENARQEFIDDTKNEIIRRMLSIGKQKGIVIP